ncbi:hypothetical protein BD311DRAFT_488657 [Dichomitus squalens]|uniref:Uncharacterized protein n=1 Tax=Dichomitus squalens TaxID=114155 RepID=A0A4V2JZQ7_9APHY|nr:hypothetical protein BD311DRAFT_488657 [Dichomitus squalens]
MLCMAFTYLMGIPRVEFLRRNRSTLLSVDSITVQYTCVNQSHSWTLYFMYRNRSGAVFLRLCIDHGRGDTYNNYM